MMWVVQVWKSSSHCHMYFSITVLVCNYRSIMNNYCCYCKLYDSVSFCVNCGNKMSNSTEETIITDYFRRGYNYSSILKFLRLNHGICMSLRTFKYRLRSFGLSRRIPPSQEVLNKMVSILRSDINGPRSSCGYRSSWQGLRVNHGVNVSRDLVIVHELRVKVESFWWPEVLYMKMS